MIEEWREVLGAYLFGFIWYSGLTVLGFVEYWKGTVLVLALGFGSRWFWKFIARSKMSSKRMWQTLGALFFAWYLYLFMKAVQLPFRM